MDTSTTNSDDPASRRTQLAESLRVEPYRVEFALETVKMWRRSFQRAMGLHEHNRYADLTDQLNYLSALDPNTLQVVIDDKTSRIAGLLAQTGSEIEHLYVHVDYQSMGLGRHLLSIARTQSPARLELYTFQRNVRAQRFYERQGFVATARGFADAASNPWANSRDDLADIRYCWQPDP